MLTGMLLNDRGLHQATPSRTEDPQVAKVRTKYISLGGREARVEVKLRDNSKLKAISQKQRQIPLLSSTLRMAIVRRLLTQTWIR